MSFWQAHLVVLPVVLPLAAGALMLLFDEGRYALKAAISVAATLALVAAAIALARLADAGAVHVYRLGDWPAPFGIVLVADRLSAVLVLLASALGFAALVFSLARWSRAGPRFHALFQFLLMGVNGAFLTGDLFNLFVFFEVFLAASYGLALYGSGAARVRAGLHYIAVNLTASLLFLIGASLLYGITGTLNMADMAIIVPTIAEDDRGLLHAGAAILAIAFLVKAAAWPFNAWLPAAYASAAAPVAALFAVMTKLGVYAILRLWTLLFPQDAGISALFGGPVLIGLGMLTLGFGVIGVIAVQQLGRMAAFCAIVSSGTLLAAIGFGRPAVTGGALYYALGSTLAVGAFFLLVELIDRARDVEEQPVYVGESDPDDEPFAFPVDLVPTHGVNLDDDEEALIGRAIPAAMAFLGLAFIVCALTIAGLPPMAGFVGKVVMLSALLNPAGFGVQAPVSPAAWLLLALLVTGGLLTIIAMSRAGIRCFWAPAGRPPPRLRIIETLPIALLLLPIGVLVWQADAVLRYANATARHLHDPRDYIGSVMAARPQPSPHASDQGGLRR